MLGADDLATLDFAGGQFQEQIDFFRNKLNLPTERYDDILRAAHDRAFIVAGAQKADLLADFRKAVDKSIAGGSIGEFRKDFAEAVRKSGWAGWAGQGTPAGEAWRTRVIYQTNIATSYAAGRWKQLNDPELKAVRPFWRYIHADGVVNPRPLHLAWGDSGLTLPNDHPFWRTHFPPNGWGCRCRVKAVRKPGAGDAKEPPAGWNTTDPRTGAPPGIDNGWDYAPGANTDSSLRDLVQEKLITYPDAITSALSRDVNRYINANTSAAQFARDVLRERGRKDPLWLGFVENYKAITALTGTDVKGYTVLIPADAPRHVQRDHGNDGGTQRPPTPEDYALILNTLNEADNLTLGEAAGARKRIVVRKQFGDETMRAVFEIRPGKKNRSVSLVTFLIKQPVNRL